MRPHAKHRRSLPPLLPALFFVFGLLGPGVLPGQAPDPPAADDPTTAERWYLYSVNGQPTGWQTRHVERRRDRVISRATMGMVVRRGTQLSKQETEATFVETVDGDPVELRMIQKQGTIPIEYHYEFLPNTVIVRQTQGDRTREETRSRPKVNWITPGRRDSRFREMLRLGVTDMVVTALDPLMGFQLGRDRWTMDTSRRYELTIAGRQVFTTRWLHREGNPPRPAGFTFLDENGVQVHHTGEYLGQKITVTLSTREAVTAAMAQSAPPEVVVSTWIQADQRIAEPRRTRRAVYELAVEDGRLPHLLTIGAQRAEVSGSRARVVVDVSSSPPVEPFDTRGYLRASPYLDYEDPQLQDLLKEALEGVGSGATERAMALRDFVFQWMEKLTFDEGYSTATEVASTRKGDCTEHAVLLTTLLRAAGIPARGVSGLVYLNFDDEEPGIFGMHMWTQALLDGRWIDLDGMNDTFDATYIAFFHSALNGDQGEMPGKAVLMGNLVKLQVRVLEVDY